MGEVDCKSEKWSKSNIWLGGGKASDARERKASRRHKSQKIVDKTSPESQFLRHKMRLTLNANGKRRLLNPFTIMNFGLPKGMESCQTPTSTKHNNYISTIVLESLEG